MLLAFLVHTNERLKTIILQSIGVLFLFRFDSYIKGTVSEIVSET